MIDMGQDWIHGKNSAEKCCGRDRGGNPTIDHHNHNNCGCGEVGTEIHYGGHGDRDCCSGRADGNNWCLARSCSRKGESGQCCRTINDYTHPWHLPHTNNCGCFHAGDAPNPNDDVGYENCCSGKASPEGNGCACIADENVEVPDGVVATDCCSGKLTEDGRHCKAATCTEVGEVKGTHGSYCCSGKDGENDKCACVPPGEKHGDEGSARDCCSHKADENKVCQFLFKGEPAPNGSDPKVVCNSGKLDRNGNCRCVHKGAETDNATDCCSGEHLNPEKHDNMCGCVATGQSLVFGAKAGACCTKTAVEGVCVCASPGEPVLGMMKIERDCCAKDTKAGSPFCGCVGPNAEHNITWDEAEYCCGGSHHFNGQGCGCVWDDIAVGSWAHDAACCSGKIVHKDDGAHVCGVGELERFEPPEIPLMYR